MSAKEMFEELGYELYYGDECNITYIKYNKTRKKGKVLNIDSVTKTYEYRTLSCFPLSIDIQLNKAIQKQIKELGWESDK